MRERVPNLNGADVYLEVTFSRIQLVVKLSYDVA